MSHILRSPSQVEIEQSQMYAFMQKMAEKYEFPQSDYHHLHEWSVSNPTAFWEEMLKFADIKLHSGYKQVCDNVKKMPYAKWFEGSTLNFAENLLWRKDEAEALVFYGEDKVHYRLSYKELHESVRKAAAALKNCEIEPGDRIAALMPNMPETVIMMLAAVSLGAVWSSASPDFGVSGVTDRFSQIEPKILIAADGYFYKGKRFDTQDKLAHILTNLPSVKTMVLVNYTGAAKTDRFENAVDYQDFLEETNRPLSFAALPFDHPLYIMYSSGTTGLPKSIVHSAGGTLLQHKKELMLHNDIRSGDRVCYFTTCGWMMWNWIVSSLSIGATLVLYDGNPFYPEPEALLQIADKERLKFFGTSAKYIAALEDAGVKPKSASEFPDLKVIASTGSPLTEANFDYVYREWKPTVQLASISGGTDIISCFVLGNPILPVKRGEIQCKGLGMDVDCWSEDGKSLTEEKGELVCKTAFPSMPIRFWNDPEGEKYRNAYFEYFPGIWHHGDYIEIRSGGGIVIHGRSDATLNPGGVRIGTAEIYRVTDSFTEIADAVVAGKQQGDDELVILFVKMQSSHQLSEDLQNRLRKAIKEKCSPRHVPAEIYAVPDIPYTLNGKKTEVSVKKIINGKQLLNRDALANPECLDYFSEIVNKNA